MNLYLTSSQYIRQDIGINCASINNNSTLTELLKIAFPPHKKDVHYQEGDLLGEQNLVYGIDAEKNSVLFCVYRLGFVHKTSRVSLVAELRKQNKLTLCVIAACGR